MNVTFFEHFTVPSGDYALLSALEAIKNGRWAPQVNEIRETALRGDAAEADRLKKQLPSFTFCALFKEKRKMDAAFFNGYNNLILLDFDHIPAHKLSAIQAAIEIDPYTFARFRSPKGFGQKVLVRLSGVPPGDVPGLKQYHCQAFNQVKAHYEQVTHLEIDASGKDINRLCFVSADEKLYLNENARCFVVTGNHTPQAAISHTTPPPRKQGRKKQPRTLDSLFFSALDLTNRTMQYLPGNRNNYCYTLLCTCNRAGIPREEALTRLRISFPDLPEEEYTPVTESAYAHTSEYNTGLSRSEKNGTPESPAQRRNTIEAVEKFFAERYVFRFNEVADMCEYRDLSAPEPETWLRMYDRHENSCWRALHIAGIFCKTELVRNLLASDYVPLFNPFTHYYDSLPPWDGTDHIAAFAARVSTTNPAYWLTCFRKWFVAMIAASVTDTVVNHTVLTLAGPQGIGKTSLARILLPPALREYSYSGKIDPADKDLLQNLSSRILINADEMEAMTARQLALFKELITKDNVDERLAFRHNTRRYIHRASFIAMVNNTDILTDTSGSRRFLCFNVTHINYHTPVDYPALYAQALHLFRTGFRYWFDRDEIDRLSANNETFQVRTIEEELFCAMYRKPREGDKVHYLTASQIMVRIVSRMGVSSARMNITNFAKVIIKRGFEYRLSHGLYRYYVYELTIDEMNYKTSLAEDNSLTSDNASIDDSDSHRKEEVEKKPDFSGEGEKELSF